jgi:hypothetical protein
MHQPLKIRLLKQLPLALAGPEQGKLFKMLETLCIIKALWVDAPMPLTPEGKQEIATASNRSTKTIGRRIDELVEIGWLKVRDSLFSADHISWDDLRTHYNIQHTHFYHIETVPGVRLEYIIDSKQDAEKLSQCEYAYHHKVDRNPELREIIETVASDAHAVSRVANHQLQCFKFQGTLYDADQRYALNLHYTNKTDKLLNADIALNYRSWSKLKGYSSRGGYAKHKRKQQQRGLIAITKRVEDLPNESPGPTTRAARYYTRAGFVQFNPEAQVLQLTQPDLIRVLPLKGLQQRFEQGQQLALLHPAKEPDRLRSAWVLKSWETKNKLKDEAKKAA